MEELHERQDRVDCLDYPVLSIIHLAITSELTKRHTFKDTDRLKPGSILPDASDDRNKSQLRGLMAENHMTNIIGVHRLPAMLNGFAGIIGYAKFVITEGKYEKPLIFGK